MNKQIKIANDIPALVINFVLNRIDWHKINSEQKSKFIEQIEKQWRILPTTKSKQYITMEVSDKVDERFIKYMNQIDYKAINPILLNATLNTSVLEMYAKKLKVPIK